MIFKSCF